ncbi:MAG: thermonuclease family protein [Pseudomonadota bacterium]
MLIIRSLIVLLLALTPVWAADLSGTARAIDGDTLDVGSARVRLFGIDAPERDQRCDRAGQSWACGRFARQVLADLIRGERVTCTVKDIDRYGRAVAICMVGQRDIGRALVQAGAAQAYLRYSNRYAKDDSRARAAGVGVWAGRMVAPEAHRHSDLAPQPQGPCRIKGNISGNGRIYHRPGQRDYDATRINEARGEAWFCTEKDARAAGFRPARR